MKIIKILFFQGLVLIFLFTGFSVLAADQSICHPGEKILLYDNGSLQTCQLKNDYDVNSIQCKNNTPINFYNNGSLMSCVLAKSTSIGMIKCQQNGLITFFIGGNLKSCTKPGN
ncbi:MAG: hypothetical protein CVU51_05180 [Deltaproteobacteria bacterium HGW-Deltaproteobacteria-1]|jgi:hypothetical protein|nr:MAG: hypothetical protein CVU51_05180 [Deltaproteobacteria bacterium HGW-Deltaproteobacteria-1]